MVNPNEREQNFSAKKGAWMATAVVMSFVVIVVGGFAAAASGSFLVGVATAVVTGVACSKIQHRRDPLHWKYKPPRRGQEATENERPNPFRSEPPSTPEAAINCEDDEETSDRRTSDAGPRSRTLWATIGTVVGFVTGSSLGVSGFGGAVNGGMLFAVLGGVIGFLAANQREKP